MRSRGWFLALEERGSTIDAHRFSRIAGAGIVACGVVGGHVPVTSENVVDVLTVGGCHGVAGAACSDCEAKKGGEGVARKRGKEETFPEIEGGGSIPDGISNEEFSISFSVSFHCSTLTHNKTE